MQPEVAADNSGKKNHIGWQYWPQSGTPEQATLVSLNASGNLGFELVLPGDYNRPNAVF